MIDVENILMDFIHNEYPEWTVVGEYQTRDNKYPVVTLYESQNTLYVPTKVGGKENHSEISYDIQVYDNSSNRRQNTKEIANEIDSLMVGMGFNRIVKKPLHNLNDATISRITLRYRALIDENLNTFTR